MISAKEARRKSLVNARGKVYLNQLDRSINNAIEKGSTNAMIKIDLTESCVENQEIMSAIIEELTELGYNVEYDYAEPLPGGCRSDQWDYNNGHIEVSW